MKIFLKEKMFNWTTFKTGGVADVVVEPENITEILLLVKFLREENYKYYILGNGSNLLISDQGIRGCIVHFGSLFSNIIINEEFLYAQSGASMSLISNALLEHNLTGFEELSGIPGTIGGAIVMNAGAYNKEISDLVISVDCIDKNNNIITIKKNDLDFRYRHSNIEENGLIVVAVRLLLKYGDKTEIQKKIEYYKKLRYAKQPIEPSAGSVFKRPENAFASILIQDSNLQGLRIGGAEVSKKHAGFIVNIDNATSTDIFKIINIVRDKIKTYYNIVLEPEIKFWGNF